MKKKDLKAGYTLEDERGRKWYLFETKQGLCGWQFNDYEIIRGNQIDVKNALNDDLTIKIRSMNPACDIVKVYDLVEYASNIFEHLYDYVNILWERKPKTKVTLELTDEQLKKIKEIINE